MKPSFANIVEKAEILFLEAGKIKPTTVDILDSYKVMREGTKVLLGSFAGFNQYSSEYNNLNSIFKLENIHKTCVTINISPMTDIEASKVTFVPIYRPQERDLSKWATTIYKPNPPIYVNWDTIYPGLGSNTYSPWNNSNRQIFQYTTLRTKSGISFIINLNFQQSPLQQNWQNPYCIETIIDLYMMRI
jgi:hypothetical protein